MLIRHPSVVDGTQPSVHIRVRLPDGLNWTEILGKNWIILLVFTDPVHYKTLTPWSPRNRLGGIVGESGDAALSLRKASMGAFGRCPCVLGNSIVARIG